MPDPEVHPEDAAWLESLAPLLLRDEYPDQMADRSCTCEPEATCGAHRLLARYDALYEHMAGLNAERRDLRAALAWRKANPALDGPRPPRHAPWFARLRARIFGRSKSVHNGGSGQ
jgi:hypothetical protein